MDSRHSRWQGRRVLVTGCDEFLGGAVTRELLGSGATVLGLLRERSRGADYVREIAAHRFHIVHGDGRDGGRLHASIAIHEVSAVFHLAETESTAVLRAANLYHSRVPVICARQPHLFLRSRDATAGRNPTGTIRFDELFGPGDRDESRFIPRVLFALLAGEGCPKPSATSRDYVFIRDAASACLDLAEAVGHAGHAIDRTIRSGWEFTDTRIVKVLTDAIAGLPLDSLPSSFANAIAETIAWYRQIATRTASPLSDPARRAA